VEPSVAGSDGSQQAREGLKIPLEQVKALVEGGVLDELLNKSPAIATMHERLATMEARTTEMTSAFGQVTEQLKTIAAALGQGPPAPAAEVQASPAGENATAGALATWAPLINALALKALGGGEAAPAQNIAGAFGQVLELFKHFTAFQVELNKSNAVAYKAMQQVLREPAPPAMAEVEP